MSEPVVGLRLLETADHPFVEMGVRAEKLGYDSIWLSESWGYDAFVKLTEMATRTEEIDLATSIVNVYSRTPAVLAMASASLLDASDGRFVLGLGASHPEFVEDLHGLQYERPLQHLHETIQLIDAFTGDEDRVSYEGEIFEVSGHPPIDYDVPIYTAALGPANRRLTGTLSDGWLPFNIPLPELESAYETVRTAAVEAGRNPDDVTVAPWIPVAVSADPADAHDAMRRHIAQYIGSFGAYEEIVGEYFPDASQVAELWAAGDREDATAAVSDEMLDGLAATGTPETVRERLLSFAERPFVDYPIIVPPSGADDELVEQTVTQLAPPKLP